MTSFGVKVSEINPGGPHVRVNVYVGASPDARAWSGTLTMRREEVEDFTQRLTTHYLTPAQLAHYFELTNKERDEQS
jgi:hypothetical protein